MHPPLHRIRSTSLRAEQVGSRPFDLGVYERRIEPRKNTAFDDELKSAQRLNRARDLGADLTVSTASSVPVALMTADRPARYRGRSPAPRRRDGRPLPRR
jgi:hypothetical protein